MVQKKGDKKMGKKYTVIINNDGALDTYTIRAAKNREDVAKEEYQKLLSKYEDLDDAEIEKWTNSEDDGFTIGATIDYCMGHEYIYHISVKVA